MHTMSVHALCTKLTDERGNYLSSVDPVIAFGWDRRQVRVLRKHARSQRWERAPFVPVVPLRPQSNQILNTQGIASCKNTAYSKI